MDDYKHILSNKLNNNNFTVSIQNDNNLYNLSVYDEFKRFLFYQTYEIINEYCGEISFKPLKNEFNNGKLFTNKELKTIFEINIDDCNSYNLNELFRI
jgi:hypothetical protein